MKTVSAKGQLRHFFHMPYSAAIGLDFGTGENAALALKVLGDTWKTHPQSARVLMWQGNTEALNKVSDLLESYGAVRKKIASLAKSVDFGEPFDIVIPIAE